MKRLNKKIVLHLTMAFILLMMAACGQANTQPAVSGTDSKETPKVASSSEPVKVVWWHAMSGANGKAVDQLVSDFNSSQNKIKVEAIYQGSYDESLNKLKASMDSKNGPSIAQVYEIGSRFMIDSKAITPMQKFIDLEKYDLSQLEENILGYYTIDGKLNSMPFNTSNPILYYNKDLFKAAGLDPEKPPVTYEEVLNVCAKLTENAKIPCGFTIRGSYMEQFFANQGAELVNNGNGRKSQATESLLNSEPGVKTLTWWKNMVDTKTAVNFGRKPDDTIKAFSAGQIALTIDTTASLRSIVKSAENSFKVGTGFLPKPSDAKEGGIIVGGGSLYIMNNRSQAEQQAAWEFIKFAVTPKQQANWHVSTAYFPITKKAYDEQVLKDNMAKYPQFQTAVDQLHKTKNNLSSQGALIGVFSEARSLTENAIEEALNGKNAPSEALNAAAKEITGKISVYNKTVSK
ncbi:MULTISPECIES: ABC transporter substrate-binding protein [unclassified Paenibacillus]|uniref:ABC transporter substrate-binding protein n=1 Tax=unclassified Paenibacillus TaxID=185978 RepID=UPI00363B54A5